MTQDDDRDEKRGIWPHPADLGTVLIAGVFLAGMVGSILWLFSSPEPVKDLFAHNKPAAAAPADNGEVTINLQQKK
jgi:hypothetical protein